MEENSSEAHSFSCVLSLIELQAVAVDEIRLSAMKSESLLLLLLSWEAVVEDAGWVWVSLTKASFKSAFFLALLAAAAACGGCLSIGSVEREVAGLVLEVALVVSTISIV